MRKRLLGKTSIAVSEIAFGGVEIGMPYGIGIKGAEDMLSEQDAIHLLNYSLDLGVNFYDTARTYGNSEKIIGRAFKGKRNDIILSTKCCHLRSVEGRLPVQRDIGKIIEKSLFQSLENLQTDFIDVFMLHQVDKEIIENDEIIKTFLGLKKENKIKATGISTYSIEETQLAIDLGIWDVIQLPFNLIDQRQASLFKLAERKGVGIVVRSVLLKGLLSEKGKNLHPELKNVEDHIKKYDELLEGTAYNLSEFATKFALSFPEVSSVLVGIDKKEYLEQAVNTVYGDYLEPYRLKRAQKLAYHDPDFINLLYWDKMNWLK